MGNQVAAVGQGCHQIGEVGCIETILSENDEDAKLGKKSSPDLVEAHAICSNLVLPECGGDPDRSCLEVTMAESLNVMMPPSCELAMSEVVGREGSTPDSSPTKQGLQNHGHSTPTQSPAVQSNWMRRSVVMAMEARVVTNDRDNQARADIDAKLEMLVREESAAVARRDYDAAKRCQEELDALQADPETLRLLGDRAEFFRAIGLKPQGSPRQQPSEAAVPSTPRPNKAPPAIQQKALSTAGKSDSVTLQIR